MANRFLIFLCFLSFYSIGVWGKHYELSDEPIDVVIVTHPKDKETLDLCIDGIRENCTMVRRIIVVSSEKLSDKCEWFDEKNFPFSIDDVALAIGKGSKRRSETFFKYHYRPAGWYFQQLAKLYAAYVIPDISSNVLVIDSDTIFLNPVEFLNETGGLFCFSRLPAKQRYLRHAQRLVPGYKRIYPKIYSVCHHMLFQKPILDDLFQTVEQFHGKPFWIAFCHAVHPIKSNGASEYEIYYNFALNQTDQVQLRELKWKNSSDLNKMTRFKNRGYHFVSFHTYMRE